MIFLLLAGILFCLQCNNISYGQETPLIFCAARKSSLSAGASILPFTEVPVNSGNNFDLASNSFTVPSTSTGGLFWLSWSIGISASSYADVRLQGLSRTPNIIRQHSLFTSGVDTTSRTELLNLDPQVDTLTLSTDYGLFSDGGQQTSFCGFSIFSTMTEVVAFNVGKTTTQTTVGTIVYNSVNVDTHTGYSTSTGQYTVKVEGVYVVSFSLASTASSVLTNNSFATLRLGSNILTSVLMLEAGQDMATQTVLVDTLVGNTLRVSLDNAPAYSDIRYQTSFMGFLYSPARSLPYAWSVLTENSYTAIDPVPFDIVLVNKGSGWNSASYIYVVQSPGAYYIHLTTGISPSSQARVELLVNGVVSFNLYRQSTQHADYDSRGRAIILRLVEGDQLRVRVPSGTSLYSDINRPSTFSGFRVYNY